MSYPPEPYPSRYPSSGLSEKSRMTAGLLQIVPGFLFTLGGVGRVYAGHTTLAILQLVATVIAWISFWCGFFLVLPFLITAACWLWFVIDGFVLLLGNSTDGSGRLLRH